MNINIYLMRFYLLLFIFCLQSAAWATDDTSSAKGWVDRAIERVEDVWNTGDNDLYLPFHAYHVRSNYTAEEIREYRENTWGLGYGRSRYTTEGNWEGIYGMSFLDSNSDVEPIVGYGYQWMAGRSDSLHAGAGYTALVTARARFAHYMLPIPGVLPLASVGYNKVNVNGTFVPGANGFGQIFFFWSTVSF